MFEHDGDLIWENEYAKIYLIEKDEINRFAEHNSGILTMAFFSARNLGLLDRLEKGQRIIFQDWDGREAKPMLYNYHHLQPGEIKLFYGMRGIFDSFTNENTPTMAELFSFDPDFPETRDNTKLRKFHRNNPPLFEQINVNIIKYGAESSWIDQLFK